jgi:hypothetical protein
MFRLSSAHEREIGQVFKLAGRFAQVRDLPQP